MRSAMMRRLVVILTLLVAVAAQAQSSRAPQIESISAAQMRADLFFLASDAMQGRLTDTPENAIAADWVLSRFERLGLKPGGHGGFDHRYHLMKASLGEGNAVSIGLLPGSGTRWDLKYGEEFYPHRFSANASAEGSLTFVGFGIVSPERKHDDYRDVARGRIAMMIEREPG